jgi:hypothetical protein
MYLAFVFAAFCAAYNLKLYSFIVLLVKQFITKEDTFMLDLIFQLVCIV